MCCLRLKCACSDGQPYIPPTKPYELSELARDLILLARYMLKPRGRLVFFLPTVTEEYEEIDVQTMLCEGMEIVANSLQNFGSWGRRVCLFRCYLEHHRLTSGHAYSSSLSARSQRKSTHRRLSILRMRSQKMRMSMCLRTKTSGKSISRGSRRTIVLQIAAHKRFRY